MKLKDLNQPAIWLFKAVILGLFIYALFSCSAYEAIGYCEKEKEYLTIPDIDDCVIIGYNKKGTKYKVMNYKGQKWNVSFEIDTMKIGDYLICEY